MLHEQTALHLLTITVMKYFSKSQSLCCHWVFCNLSFCSRIMYIDFCLEFNGKKSHLIIWLLTS